jgi:ribosomal protein S18 acetylase RimI-like enzyme
VNVCRLGPGDEAVVAALATRKTQTELLADDRTLFLAAFDGEESVGFVLAYELLRRHGDRSILFVYEIEVAEAHRRRGIGTVLMRELERYASERGIREGFLLTDEANEPAMRFYEALGGVRERDDDVLFVFTYD